MASTRIGVGGPRGSYVTITAKVEAVLINGLYTLIGEFPTGQSDVVISIYDVAASITAGSLTAVTITTARCIEIGGSGMYYWNTANLSTPIKLRTELLWQMTDGATDTEGVLIYDGVDSHCHAILCR